MSSRQMVSQQSGLEEIVAENISEIDDESDSEQIQKLPGQKENEFKIRQALRRMNEKDKLIDQKIDQIKDMIRNQ